MALCWLDWHSPEPLGRTSVEELFGQMDLWPCLLETVFIAFIVCEDPATEGGTIP